ncbi:glycoside hydrolase [Lactobacillus selangorensis]|uniref:Glycoside hydrolase n=1 Tax=Lactobacillus selangorensis TaxID=81857 RepID=A0A0R2FWP5_9LACO|nr:glycoside hydrolase family 65 protein [Lactobacillus selangorensis]KRN28966.1 glycoside hydrolase [Lactobacillus selangorensis]KRN32624.1 glycoside hydrolase [Lactobacillus selangorensis]
MQYGEDSWSLTAGVNKEDSKNKATESLFTVGNGYLGIRGSFEDKNLIQSLSSTRGTYINGFYEQEPIVYGESAYGYPNQRQSIINLPDASSCALYLDGEHVDDQNGEFLVNSRNLKMKNGQMIHHFKWRSYKSNKTIAVTFSRLVSFKHQTVAAFLMDATAVDFKDGRLKVVSQLDRTTDAAPAGFDPRLSQVNTQSIFQNALAIEKEDARGLDLRTLNSNQEVLIGITHDTAGEWHDLSWEKTYDLQNPVSLTKYAVYLQVDSEKDTQDLLWQQLAEAKKIGFAKLAMEQKVHLDVFWEHAAISIDGDDELQQALHFVSYQLLQAAGQDSKRSISAKGLTSTGYEGHYFWDTEIYILPFFLMNQPETARNLLLVRYEQLQDAKVHAQNLSLKGALYPWRTINGEEASAYFPASTAAIHIDADIMYAVQRYYEVTQDRDFLDQYGLEMLVETSRFYISYGDFVPGKGFTLNTVTGPDEYTALVDNNAYTNFMVQNQLYFLLKHFTLEQASRFGVTQAEWETFKKAADEMFIYRRGDLIGQDDTFLDKGKWDLANTPKENFPLMLHYHPLIIYRKQVLKQADLILAMVPPAEVIYRPRDAGQLPIL